MNYPNKYHLLIDEQIWVFIEHSNAFYPPDIANCSITDQRSVYDQLCREFFNGYPPGIVSEDGGFDTPCGTVSFRHYRNDKTSDRTGTTHIVYFHGGGFVVGGLESHDDICAEICIATGFDLVSIDYRLAPEHKHPAQFEDALAGYKAIAEIADGPIILAGDSAGATLAAAVCHATRNDNIRPAGQVLIYPALGSDTEFASHIEHAHAPLLTLHDMEIYNKLRGGKKGDPTAFPLDDDNFSGLPPCVVFSAEYDPLSSDGEAYCKRIIKTGGKAQWIEEKGLVHGYLRARHSARRAGKSFERINSAITMLANRKWFQID